MHSKPIILYTGQEFVVEFAIQLSGISDSYNFFQDLERKKKARILRVIKRYADFGKINNREQFRKVEGDLWEFKNYQTRIIMYHCTRGVIALTNGFIKKGDRIPPAEISRANRIKQEYDIKRKEICHE